MTAYIKNVDHRCFRWIVYTIMWGWLWAFPLVTTLISVAQGKISFSWVYIFPTWIAILPFFLLFVLHHLLLHILLPRKLTRLYIVLTLCLLAGFCVVRYVWQYPKMRIGRDFVPPFERSRFIGEERKAKGRDTIVKSLPSEEFARRQERALALRPLREMEIENGSRPIELPMPMALDLIISLLMLGCDFTLVLLSRYQQEKEDEQKRRETHLKHELQYLKAQIHPHFFMNMLNNIHGMVEIDPTRAQEMIMELSKLMRYVLYDGAQLFTSFQKEKEFVANYVNLMRKRYSNKKVSITLEMSQDGDDGIMVPPLLFITVIENAFKHGVSYRAPSFVAIRLSVEEGFVNLVCDNSVHEAAGTTGNEGGVGLANLRQRLHLLYGERFTLDITPTRDTYHVKLMIPQEYETDKMPCY